MKTIKVMIAASEEMHDEKTQFQSLINQLNEALAPRGIELKRVKWNPDTDGTIEDYLTKLHDCEMCLTLYWKELARNSEEELNKAYQKLKDGDNPRKLYVFFKEPAEYLSDALKDFKANFVTNYGHFFCKFENVDTMNLHFILQFEAYQNRIQGQQNKIVEIKDGKVMVGEKNYASFDKVPFAALNKEHQQMQRDLLELDIQVAEARKRHNANPNNEELEDEFFAIKNQRKEKAEELEKYQTHLYDIALYFTKLTGEQWTERMRKAKELFELGDAIGADQILNMEEMKREAKNELKQFEKNRHNLELKIEEFRLKADTVMANTLISIPNRFTDACNAYEQAISIARKIHYSENELISLLFNFAFFLSNYKRNSLAENYYIETIKICQQSSKKHFNENLLLLATIYENLSHVQLYLHKEEKALKMAKKTIAIYQQLTKDSPQIYLPKMAMAFNSLANVEIMLNHSKEAESSYLKALSIIQQLEKEKPGGRLEELSIVLHNLGSLYYELGLYSKSEKIIKEALEKFYKLEKEAPTFYSSNIAKTLIELSKVHYKIGLLNESEKELKSALDIFIRLEKENPEIYMIELALSYYWLANFYSKLKKYEKAYKNYRKAQLIFLKIKKRTNENYTLLIETHINILSELAFIENDFELYRDAENHYQEALDILQVIAKQAPNKYLPHLANLTARYAKMKYWQENSPESQVSRHLSSFLTPYYSCQHNSNQLIKITSNSLFLRALSIYEKLEKQNKGNYNNQIKEIKNYINEE